MGNKNDDGLIQRISKQIFKSISCQSLDLEFTVNTSFMEVYMENLVDLLSPNSQTLSIKDSAEGIYVKNLCQVFVSSPQEILDILETGLLQRRTSKTRMNETSSRSHAIFIIRISCKNTLNGIVKSGKLMFVDLAGSEKVKKTGATGQTLEEAKKINKSLSALGNVINALTSSETNRSHIPYRDSKLTRLLQDSIGGNSKTTLIVNISPSKCNMAETISTLRFGVRAKCIKNHIRVNQELPSSELKKLLFIRSKELEELRNYSRKLEEELKKWRTFSNVPSEEWTHLMSDGKIDSKIDLEESPHLENSNSKIDLEELLEEKEAAILEKDEIIQELKSQMMTMRKDNVKSLELLEITKDGQLSSRTESLSTIFEEAIEELSITNELPKNTEGALLNDSLTSIRRSQSTVFEHALEESCVVEEDESRDEFFEPRAISDKEMQKMLFLEQSLDQLSKIQKQLVDQNLELKKSMSVSEKKLLSRTEKIVALEKCLEEAQQKLENNDVSLDKNTINPFFHPRIVKPLRGGSQIPPEISTPGSKKSVWYINLVKTPK